MSTARWRGGSSCSAVTNAKPIAFPRQVAMFLARTFLHQGAVATAARFAEEGASLDLLASTSRILDPAIVEAMVHPVTDTGELTSSEEELLRLVAEGKPIKAIAAGE